MMQSILITGCNRGLGLGIVRHLVKGPRPPKHVIATYRDETRAEELKNLAGQHNNVHVLQLDVNKFETYNEFVAQVSEIVKDDGLNVLLNNAGVSPKFTRLNLVKLEQLINALNTNTIAPILLTKHMLPLLKKAVARNREKPLGSSKAAVIHMSSTLGSIDNNRDGGFYPYRCSKAALNMATRSMSIDLKSESILVACLHPGWVKTDMGGPKAPMDVQISASSIMKFIDSLDEEQSGGFYQWDGSPLPW